MNTAHSLRLKPSRKGNVLVGCLIALGVALVLVIIATVFVVKSWRGWASTGIKQGITAVLNETQIEQVEKDEINAHIENLMTQFEDKEVSLEQLGLVSVQILEGPLLPAGLVVATYEGYIANSELEDDIKADAKLQLARVAHGIYTEDIPLDDLEDILDSLKAPALSSSNSNIRIQTGNYDINLKDPNDVTTEELLELIANAQAASDAAEIPEVPTAIDLSNEVAIAIANALGEDPSLWLPEGVEAPAQVEEPETDDNADEPTAEPSTDTPNDDGP